MQELHEHVEVPILDVSSVLAQVDGDAVGSRALGEHGGVGRVRLVDATRLAQRGNVIDVDAQPYHGGILAAPRRRSGPAPSSADPPPVLRRAAGGDR
jgi:hypothetical protein